MEISWGAVGSVAHTKKWVLSLLSYRIFHYWPSSPFPSFGIFVPLNVSQFRGCALYLKTTLLINCHPTNVRVPTVCPFLWSPRTGLVLFYTSRKKSRGAFSLFLFQFGSGLYPHFFRCALHGVESPFLCSLLSLSRRLLYQLHPLMLIFENSFSRKRCQHLFGFRFQLTQHGWWCQTAVG